jgi:hypothetical protein
VRKLLFLAVVAFVAAMVAMMTSAKAQSRVAEHNRERFVGAWRLAWLEQPGADGKSHRLDCTGLLVYSEGGHMSVQVMYRKPQPAAGPQSPYVQGGYEASFGAYTINDSHTFTYHVEGALVRDLIGKDLPRFYEFSGKQLIVQSTNPNEHWRVAWERD